MGSRPRPLLGEPVEVVEPRVARDALGRPARSESRRLVGNVLLAPPDTSSMAQLDADVCLVAYWPKSDPGDLRGRDVVARAGRFSVVGEPSAYPADLTPGPWDRVVRLRRAAEDGGGR